MKKIKFDCHRSSAPAYSCDTPGDNSGYYYMADDVELLIDKLSDVLRFEKDFHVTTAEILGEFMKWAK